MHGGSRHELNTTEWLTNLVEKTQANRVIVEEIDAIALRINGCDKAHRKPPSGESETDAESRQESQETSQRRVEEPRSPMVNVDLL
jgi:hypothetical protein